MNDSIPGRWMLVIPPEGAARQAGEYLWAAMESALSPDRHQRFDTAANLRVFDHLLKQPTDDMTVDLMGQSLIVQALDFAATHVLVMALSPVTYFTINLLKRQGVKTLHWFIEDYRQAHYWEKVIPAYSHWFAIQRGPMQAACLQAGTHFEYLPTAAGKIPEGPIKPWQQRRVDVAFVGIPSPYRVRVLEALHDAGISLSVAGSGWERYSGPLRSSLVKTDWVDGAAALELLGDARIGLHAPYEDPKLDRAGCHVSPRLYEVLACGCALLCEEAPLCREALGDFAPAFFSGPESAVAAAQNLLPRPLSPEDQIRQRSVVSARHHYRERFAVIAKASA